MFCSEESFSIQPILLVNDSLVSPHDPSAPIALVAAKNGHIETTCSGQPPYGKWCSSKFFYFFGRQLFFIFLILKSLRLDFCVKFWFLTSELFIFYAWEILSLFQFFTSWNAVIHSFNLHTFVGDHFYAVEVWILNQTLVKLPWQKSTSLSQRIPYKKL